MKNRLIKLLTFVFFVSASILSFSKGSNGTVHFISTAHAQESWLPYAFFCNDGTFFRLCGEGGTGCIPVGRPCKSN